MTISCCARKVDAFVRVETPPMVSRAVVGMLSIRGPERPLGSVGSVLVVCNRLST